LIDRTRPALQFEIRFIKSRYVVVKLDIIYYGNNNTIAQKDKRLYTRLQRGDMTRRACEVSIHWQGLYHVVPTKPREPRKSLRHDDADGPRHIPDGVKEWQCRIAALEKGNTG